MTTYNLSLSQNFQLNNLYKLDSSKEKSDLLKLLNLKQKIFTYNNNKYGLITYDKTKLNNNNVFTTGLFRSIIHSENKIHVFSPPKSVDFNLFMNNTNIVDVDVEEYVEGTMINMFWDEANNNWEISTKNIVGADNRFFVNNLSNNKNSFKIMFNDFVNSQKDFYSNFNKLPKNYCYSFVLQHPKNRIVVPLKQLKLYLVSIYEINELFVTRLSLDKELLKKLPDFLSYPIYYKCNSWEDVYKLCRNSFSIYIVGFVLTDRIRNIRSKIRNQNYEYVRKLRGNQPKLKFTYLTLRLSKNIKNYLHHYPEHKIYFDMYHNEILNFSKNLHKYYIDCYIKKLKPLKQFNYEYRKYMFNLHDIYKTNLRNNNKVVTFKYVYNYINNIPPQLLMYSLNYKYRKHIEDSNDVEMKVNEKDELNKEENNRVIEKSEGVEESHDEGVDESHEEGVEESHDEGVEESHDEGVDESHEEGVEESHEEGVDESHDEGVEESHEEGVDESHDEGVDESHEEGVEESHDEGVDESHEEGVEESKENNNYSESIETNTSNSYHSTIEYETDDFEIIG